MRSVPMSIYAIILNSPDESVWQNIKDNWEFHHVLDDRLAFVRAENALTADIAKQVGISEEGASGVVIQMDYFSGHTKASLVEWVSKNRD